jgi:N-methylhydantoinase A
MLLGVDTGGTFTDFVLFDGNRLRFHKSLSTPDDPARAIDAGVAALGIGDAVRAGRVTIIHGSTVATNAALEGKGVRTAYITNRGFTDVLKIGRQARRELYSLTPTGPPDPVPAELLLGTGGRIGPDGECIEPLTEADLAELRRAIVDLAPDAIAINLLYSYLDDTNERRIEAALGDLAFVSRSSYVLREYREYERGIATWLNAWLGPVVGGYLNRLSSAMAPSPVAVMQSSGGIIGADGAATRAVNLLLSGPAGGLAAAAHLGAMIDTQELLTFDMGGTSTDVSLIHGRPALTDEGRIGPYPVAIPMADIHTIGAGGGSIAYLDAGGVLHVGPRSAGADPGPACYGRGGAAPTVTDANVVLGRLPAGQRLGGFLTLDVQRARRAVAQVAEPLGLNIEDAAAGIIELANQHMAQALKVISLERGHDPRRYTLVCFGGAGGLHVCALAELLELRRVVVPLESGVFSALGMLVADRSRHLTQTVNRDLDALRDRDVATLFDRLATQGRRELERELGAALTIAEVRCVDLRYRGQTFTLTVPWTTVTGARQAFHEAHQSRYGHAFELPLELVNVRCELRVPQDALTLPRLPRRPAGKPEQQVSVTGIGPLPVFQRGALAVAQRIDGPALIVETTTTTLLAPQWRATVDSWGNLQLDYRGHSAGQAGPGSAT